MGYIYEIEVSIIVLKQRKPKSIYLLKGTFFAAKFKRFIDFVFGDTTYMWFVKNINFMIYGFIVKLDTPGIKQGLAISTDLFFGFLLVGRLRPAES